MILFVADMKCSIFSFFFLFVAAFFFLINNTVNLEQYLIFTVHKGFIFFFFLACSHWLFLN